MTSCASSRVRCARDGCQAWAHRRAASENCVRRWLARTLVPSRPFEALIRLLLVGEGLAPETLQLELFDTRGRVYARLDLAWPSVKLAVEADVVRLTTHCQPSTAIGSEPTISNWSLDDSAVHVGRHGSTTRVDCRAGPAHAEPGNRRYGLRTTTFSRLGDLPAERQSRTGAGAPSRSASCTLRRSAACTPATVNMPSS